MAESRGVKVSNSLGAKIELSRKALAMFDARERSEVLKVSLDAAGQRWIAQVLPKRYNKAYMQRAPFNHHIGSLSLRQKIRKASFQGQRPGRGGRFDFSRLRPLIMSGRMHDRSLKDSDTKTRDTKNNLTTVIRVRLGHGVRTETHDLIKTMPRREIETIGNDFERNVARIINASTVRRTKKGNISKRGGVARRSTSGVKAQNTIRSLRERF